MSRLLEIYPAGKRVCSWSMRQKALDACEADDAIKRVTFDASTGCWW